MFISKLDEDNYKLTKVSMSISDVAQEVSESFNVLASSNGKQIKTEIEPNLMITGEVSMIGELISTLLDNAIKYASDDSIIKLNLYAHSKYICLVVQNNVDKIEPGDHNYLLNVIIVRMICLSISKAMDLDFRLLKQLLNFMVAE